MYWHIFPGVGYADEPPATVAFSRETNNNTLTSWKKVVNTMKAFILVISAILTLGYSIAFLTVDLMDCNYCVILVIELIQRINNGVRPTSLANAMKKVSWYIVITLINTPWFPLKPFSDILFDPFKFILHAVFVLISHWISPAVYLMSTPPYHITRKA